MHNDRIVISGLSGRFPNCDNVQQFAEQMYGGKEMATINELRHPKGLWGLPKRTGVVPSMSKFDAEMFKLRKEHVQSIDPQERLLFELTYEAILDAGLKPKDIAGKRTGLYHGTCFGAPNEAQLEPETLSSYPNKCRTRLATFFDIKGPIFHSDTACASGLSAFNEAYHSIRVGLIDTAIVAGYNNLMKARMSVNFKRMRMISDDGRSKCLDKSANGYCRAEALVVLVLQRAEVARRGHCEILACQSNSDGYKSDGVTFPSVRGQKELLDLVYRKAGLSPNDIDYVEAHVTGTQAGDVVEANSLDAFFFADNLKRSKPLYLGCLKSSIGHSEGASGLCSITKAILIHKLNRIPPNLHYRNPNPNIPGLHSGRLIPVTKEMDFSADYIAINCFGFGGTNIHLITRKLTDVPLRDPINFPRLITVASRTEETVKNLLMQVQTNPKFQTEQTLQLLGSLADLTVDQGFDHRGFLVVDAQWDIMAKRIWNERTHETIPLPQFPNHSSPKLFNSEIPFLSPFIHWRHDFDWDLRDFTGDASNNYHWRTVKSIQYSFEPNQAHDEYLYDHVINRRPIFPGVGYLFYVWKTFCELLGAEQFNTTVQFRNVRFISALWLLKQRKDQRIGFTVRINESTGKFEVLSNGEQALLVQGYISVSEFNNWVPFEENGESIQLIGAALYSELEQRGYNYGPYFRGIRSAEMHGRFGEIIWRDTMPRTVKESITDKEILRSVQFSEFIPFADSMLQLQLLDPDQDHRLLALPTSIGEMMINPKLLLQSIQKSPKKFDDPLTNSLSFIVPSQRDRDTGQIEVTGMRASNVKGSIVIRRSDPLSKSELTRQLFIAFNQQFGTELTDNPFNLMVEANLAIVIENLVSKPTELNILLIGSERINEKLIRKAIESHLLSDLIKTKFTHLHSETLIGSMANQRFNLIIGENCYLVRLAELLVNSGFILTLNPKHQSPPEQLIQLTNHAIKNSNETAKLYRLVSPIHQSEIQTIQITNNNFNWIDTIKEAISDSEVKRLWICTNQKINGLVGMLRSLRLEPDGHKLRVLIDGSDPENKSLTISDVMVKSDLLFSIRRSLSEGFGHFMYCGIEQRNLQINTDDYYLRIERPGDLSSFIWCQNNCSAPSDTDKVVIDVHYSALNFRDLMFATKKLRADAIPYIDPRILADSFLGFEFAGRDPKTGARYMGIVEHKALASKISVDQRTLTDPGSFIWQIPDNWTYEQAASVCGAYVTAYYALVVRGRIQPFESILIHSAAGGVGLAAVAIAIKYRCDIYLTCGSDIKKDFILEHFGYSRWIKRDQIFNSRNTKFEEEILIRTHGRGVDLVLNSLAGNKLQSSIRCLASFGRFLEIGKVDFVENSALQVRSALSINQEFHGILLDALQSSPTPLTVAHRKELHQLMKDGLKVGEVKPLPITIFDKDIEEVTKAFRLMATGNHRGKILIQMREANAIKDLVNPLMKGVERKLYFDSEKNYLVIGALGGIGLQLIQFMVDHGATHLTLLTRTGVKTDYQRFVLEKLRIQKVHVELEHLDPKKDSLQQARQIISNSKRIGGIFSLAGIIEDKLFANLDHDSFKRVLNAKFDLVWSFDFATRELSYPLDYFVVFSSLSSARGNIGQSNYNYANSMVESICDQRRLIGLHGLAVQLGPIGDVGLMSDSVHKRLYQSLPFEMQPIQIALKGIESVLLASQTDQINCSSITCFARSASDNCVADKAKTETDLVRIIASIMGTKDIDQLDDNLTLIKLGIDSLINLEIRQIIERTTSVNLSLKQVQQLTIKELRALNSSMIKN